MNNGLYNGLRRSRDVAILEEWQRTRIVLNDPSTDVFMERLEQNRLIGV